MQERSEALSDAMTMLQAGDGLGAERRMVEAVKQVRASEGEDSMAYARAQFELGQILLGVGDAQRAVGALQAAIDVTPQGEEETGLHLTMLMNFGEVLRHVGQLEHAAQVLRRGATAREAHYGLEHAGFAYGLEPLAEVLLLLGETDEAASLADEALRIFWEAGNPRVAAALGLAAFTRAGLNDDTVALRPEDWLPRFDALPSELQEDAVAQILRRAEHLPASAVLPVLEHLQPHVEAVHGPTHPWAVRLLASITNVARSAGDDVRRIAAFEALRERFERAGDVPQEVQVLQGLALALADAGRASEAEAAYEAALSRAESGGDPRGASAAARNLGLWLLDEQRTAEGLAALARAVELGREVGGSVLGRALVAYGVQVQHQGDLDTARESLRQALELLEPSEPDTLAARSHLQAIETGGSCGCGDMGEALSNALRDMVLPHIPEGLLADLRYLEGEAGELKLDVQLAREATDEEMELLDRVIRQAVATLQQQTREAGFSR